MEKRFLKWLIKVFIPGYHLAKNGSGRKKKIDHLNIDNLISEEYRTSHLQGNFPGKSLGD